MLLYNHVFLTPRMPCQMITPHLRRLLIEGAVRSDGERVSTHRAFFRFGVQLGEAVLLRGVVVEGVVGVRLFQDGELIGRLRGVLCGWLLAG